jgi:hypothetical protein
MPHLDPVTPASATPGSGAAVHGETIVTAPESSDPRSASVVACSVAPDSLSGASRNINQNSIQEPQILETPSLVTVALGSDSAVHIWDYCASP